VLTGNRKLRRRLFCLLYFAQGFPWGFTTVCLFSLYMRLSWTGAAACQFTLYMAISNGGYALGAGLNRLNSWIAGWVDFELATHHFYYVAAFMATIPLLTLPFINPADVEKRKEKEMLVEIAPSSSSPEG
jgi:hypothetical protein